MGEGQLIITASGATPKNINRLLLHLREWGWEGDEMPSWDWFQILRTTEGIAPLHTQVEGTSPPVQDFSDNEFKEKPLAEVEKLMITKRPKGDHDRFLLLDDKGIEDGTIILAERASTWLPESGEFIYHDNYRKMRLPWEKVSSTWTNIDIGNLSFEEYCVDGAEDKGAQGDYWFTYDEAFIQEDPEEDLLVRKRNLAILALEKLDLA